MAINLAHYGVQYAVYLLELILVVFLVARGRWRRLSSLFVYLILLFAVDGVARPYVLYRYGIRSGEYASFFWRACAKERNLWHSIRLLLVFVFIIVLGVSFISLSRNYKHLFPSFIIEFGQNLYFSCLVLNTLLYLLLQQLQSQDDELGMLVCGTGIQFAGPAATLALFHLSAGQGYARVLTTFIQPLCTLGMLLTSFYAVGRVYKPAAVPVVKREGAEVEGMAVSKA